VKDLITRNIQGNCLILLTIVRMSLFRSHYVRIPIFALIDNERYCFHFEQWGYPIKLSIADDLDNQSAFKLAKDADPQGLRTIGVSLLLRVFSLLSLLTPYSLQAFSQSRILCSQERKKAGWTFWRVVDTLSPSDTTSPGSERPTNSH
jgi:hypothetical protein